MTNPLPPTENWEEWKNDIASELLSCGVVDNKIRLHLVACIENLLKDQTRQARLDLLERIYGSVGVIFPLIP